MHDQQFTLRESNDFINLRSLCLPLYLTSFSIVIMLIGSGENDEGEDRLRFYLKDNNNSDSKPDSIALTVKDGQQRIVIDATNIDTIELSQKAGHFHFKTDGNYKVSL